MAEADDTGIRADDDCEFLVEEPDATCGESHRIGDEPLSAGRPGESLAVLAERSYLAPKQREGFRTVVELDLLRPPDERIGLEELFRICCRYGDRIWLDPSVSLKVLDGILERFACRGKERAHVLHPVIELLADLAGKGISPAAFLDYVILPRMAGDNDWRRWNGRHLEALEIIGNLLVSMKKGPPFDRHELGTGRVKLIRDIVLVKYTGKPLALYPLSDLRDSGLLERYLLAWRRLRIDNAFTILFLKTNILHFMYAMSGRIDLVQLVMIIENMPEIESGFRENFPDSCFNIDVSRIDMNLYDYDMSREIYSRRQKGFSSYDFAVEMKSYLSIILALLGTGSGIFLCGYFARRLSVVKDPDTARNMSELIRVIRDDGGRHVYVWHARRMMSLPAADRETYITMVGNCGGRDPEYPDPMNYFNGAGLTGWNFAAFEKTLATLGLSSEDFDPGVLDNMATQDGNKRYSIPHHAWIDAYLRRYPGRKEDIERYAAEVTRGEDRLWDRDRVCAIDELGIPLHTPLLHMVIPGLGGSLAGVKSMSFQDLYLRYRTVVQRECVPGMREFRLPLHEMDSFDRFRNAEIRGRINMPLVRRIWCYVEEEGDAAPSNLLFHVNGEHRKILSALESRNERYAAGTDRGMTVAEGTATSQPGRKAAALGKAVEHMTVREREYEALLSEIPVMNDNEKIVTALIVAGRQAETGDDFALFAMNLLLTRYKSDVTLGMRLKSLRQDVVPELVTLRQMEMIVETLDSLARIAAADSGFERVITGEPSGDGRLGKLLAPFILTRKKRLSMEALDAAIRSTMAFSRLTAELERWHELEESFNSGGAKYFEPCRLYTSRSVMDAYYGDMGSICLAGLPEAITDPALHVIRLASDSEQGIRGIALMYRSQQGLASYMKHKGPFWHVFAFNPLPSFLHHLTRRRQLYLYLNYRALVEDVSRWSGLPVVLSGIHSWSIISNTRSFADLILSFEKRYGAPQVDDAKGLSLLYSEESYSDALVIIDPLRRETLMADNLLRSFDWHLAENIDDNRTIPLRHNKK